MNKVILNKFGIPFFMGNFHYPENTPLSPALLVFNGILYEDLFDQYLTSMQPIGAQYEEALKHYIIYFMHWPGFQVPIIIKQHFQMHFNPLSPAQMMLTLMEYGIEFFTV